MIVTILSVCFYKRSTNDKDVNTNQTQNNGNTSSKYVLGGEGVNNKDGIEGGVGEGTSAVDGSSNQSGTSGVGDNDSTNNTNDSPKPTLSPEERFEGLKTTSEDQEDTKHIPDEIRDYALYNDFLFGTTDNETYKEDKTIEEINNTLQIARDFTKEFFNISYKDIDTEEKYKKREKKILYYFENGSTWLNNSNETYSAKDYVKTWLDLIKSTKTTIKTTFYTDRKLVYGYPSTIVRGAFQYKVVSCSDVSKLNDFTCLLVSKTSEHHKSEKPVKIGTSYYSAVEFTLTNTFSSADGWETGQKTIQSYSILGNVKEGVL